MGAVEFTINYTYDDYKLWEGDWELYEGYPISMAPAPMINHQAVAYEIAREIGNSIEKCSRCLVVGESDYKLDDNTIFRPDVVLICDEPNDAYITKAPEIVVEVISPSTAKNDETYKLKRYEEEGVKYYILAYPKTLVAKVYKLVDGEFVQEGELSKESYEFEETTCSVTINFEKIFRRFRRD